MIERIKQLDRERRTKALMEQQQVEREYKKQKLAGIREKEYRLNLLRINTERIMLGSGVLSGLRIIENELPAGRFLKHNLIYKPEKGEALLVWGNNYTIQDGELHSAHNFPHPEPDFDAVGIEVHAWPHNNSVSIEGSNNECFDEETWKQHPNIIEEALRQAYLNPREFTSYKTPETRHTTDPAGH